MASVTLYPPIVNDYAPAFAKNTGGNTETRIYFSLSKFNVDNSLFTSSPATATAHVSIKKQGSGIGVVNKTNTSPIYRSTGIILNKKVELDTASGQYFITLDDDDIASGFTAGFIYQIQIRLSPMSYPNPPSDYSGTPRDCGEAAWLNEFANWFSEWSTVCIIKCTHQPKLRFLFNSTSNRSSEDFPDDEISVSDLSISGTYSNVDKTENLYSYSFVLQDHNTKEELENSGILYSNIYADVNQFNYNFKTIPEGGHKYDVTFTYQTTNDYTQSGTIKMIFASQNANNIFRLLTTDNPNNAAFDSISEEEDEGRIGLRIEQIGTIPNSSTSITGFIIKRSSSRSNFTQWEIIKELPYNAELLTHILYDYTIESGIWYKYGIAYVRNGVSTALNQIANPIMRDFNNSFLLGENEQQLKISFNNTLSSFKINVGDTKTDTIGGKYPFITRNGNMYYATFQIGGMISWQSDEKHTFITEEELFGSMTNNYRQAENTNMARPIYEKHFRDKVIHFLSDSKPKLYKSRTEGNFVVRLMNVNFTPEQGLGRVIYSFTADATEIADAKLETYEKYKLCDIHKTDYISPDAPLDPHTHEFPPAQSDS